MNAQQEDHIRTMAVIYGAAMKLMEENYDWWVTAPTELVVDAIMKETRGHYSVDMVRDCLEGRHGHSERQ